MQIIKTTRFRFAYVSSHQSCCLTLASQVSRQLPPSPSQVWSYLFELQVKSSQVKMDDSSQPVRLGSDSSQPVRLESDSSQPPRLESESNQPLRLESPTRASQYDSRPTRASHYDSSPTRASQYDSSPSRASQYNSSHQVFWC